MALRLRLRRRLASEARRAAGVLLRVAQQVESPRGPDPHDDGSPVEETAGGPPEHWLAVVRARAPQLLEGRGIGVRSGNSPVALPGRPQQPNADTSIGGGSVWPAGVPGDGAATTPPAPATPRASQERPAAERTTRTSPRWPTPAAAAPGAAAARWPVAPVPPAPVAAYAEANGGRATSAAWPDVLRPSPWPASERWPVVTPAATAPPRGDAPVDRPAASAPPVPPTFPPGPAPVPLLPSPPWSALGPVPAPVPDPSSSPSPDRMPEAPWRIEQVVATPSGPAVDFHDAVTGPWPSLPSAAGDDAPAPLTPFDSKRIERLDAEQQGR